MIGEDGLNVGLGKMSKAERGAMRMAAHSAETERRERQRRELLTSAHRAALRAMVYGAIREWLAEDGKDSRNDSEALVAGMLTVLPDRIEAVLTDGNVSFMPQA